jgi:hypothetical protein
MFGMDDVVFLKEVFAIHREKASRCIEQKSKQINSSSGIIDPVVERPSMIIDADQLNKYLLDHEDDGRDEKLLQALS